MKKVIKVLIIVLIILMLLIGGVFAYLYFATDTFRTNKQMFLKYVQEIFASIGSMMIGQLFYLLMEWVLNILII